MAPKSYRYPPSTRRILNEIMLLLFVPEAAFYRGISTERVRALISQFDSAAKSDIFIVKSLLSELVDQLAIVENRIELREDEEAKQVFQARLEAEIERRRTNGPETPELPC